MRRLTKTVIDEFNESFYPQEIMVAEVAVSRFLGGDKAWFIAADYKKQTLDIHRAIRFFFLMAKGNKSIKAVYDDYQSRRFQ